MAHFGGLAFPEGALVHIDLRAVLAGIAYLAHIGGLQPKGGPKPRGIREFYPALKVAERLGKEQFVRCALVVIVVAVDAAGLNAAGKPPGCRAVPVAGVVGLVAGMDNQIGVLHLHHSGTPVAGFVRVLFVLALPANGVRRVVQISLLPV